MAALTAVVTDTAVILLGNDGTQSTLAFPSGVVATGRRARIVYLGNRLVIVNATTSPIWLSPDLNLRLLSMPTPQNAPVLSSGGAGSYTGVRKARISFVLRDPGTGTLLAEGPLSPESVAFSFSAQKCTIGSLAIPASNQPVSGRRIYLTTAGGSTYFAAFDLDDITTTSITTSVADAALSTVAAPDDLVAAPTDLDMITVWKNRLWGRTNLDTVQGTSVGTTYRWPNGFEVEPAGSDLLGVTGFLSRRDELGILRRDRLWKLVGDSETDFSMIKVIDGKGTRSPDTCLVIRDVGYFLGDDGVYTWGPEGVVSVTDGLVRPWFTSDTYFNRAQFTQAFAAYDPIRHRYLLFLCSAGSTNIDRWVEFDILSQRWWGIHKCAAFTKFSSGTVGYNASDVPTLFIGASDGFIYQFDPTTPTDGASTAIDFDVFTKHHSDNPDYMHAWLMASILNKQESGGTLQVTPYLDTIGAAAGAAQNYSLAQERGRLARFGMGRLLGLRFRENTAGQGVSLYGYRLPFVTVGRR